MGLINPICSGVLKKITIQWYQVLSTVAFSGHFCNESMEDTFSDFPSIPLRSRIAWSHCPFPRALRFSVFGRSQLLLSTPEIPSWLTGYWYSNILPLNSTNFHCHIKSQKHMEVFLWMCSKDRFGWAVHGALCAHNALHSSLSLLYAELALLVCIHSHLWVIKLCPVTTLNLIYNCSWLPRVFCLKRNFRNRVIQSF